MSDGITHHRIWKRGWVLALPLSFSALTVGEFLALGVLVGYGLGRYIEPDLDQSSITSSEGRMINEIPVIGHLLFGYWSIYGSIFRRSHRSTWTHLPLLSTLLRIFYQFWPLFLIMWWKDWNYPWIWEIFGGILIGLSFADFLHWFEDLRSEKMRWIRKLFRNT